MDRSSHGARFGSRVSPHYWRVEQDAWLLSEPPASAFHHDLRVVALGGGTGLPVVLRGMRPLLLPSGPAWAETADPTRLTGIVTVADDGGSSGRLRREHGIAPPGDIRSCLVALADGDPVMARLFDFRFEGRGETAGHSLGNLILTALSRIGNGFDRAIEQGARLLTSRGQVFPSTLDSVALRAHFTDGSTVIGESKIAQARRPIQRVSLEPADARAVVNALTAIETADLIVLGPGSLYTSLLPNLLIKEIEEGIARSRGRVVLVANLMTEPGETDDYTIADHVSAIHRHAPKIRIHDVLIDTTPIPGDLAVKYKAEGACRVASDVDAIQALGCRVLERPLLARGSKARHDPHELARALVELGRLAEHER